MGYITHVYVYGIVCMQVWSLKLKMGKWCYVAKELDITPDKMFHFRPVLDEMVLNLQLCILPKQKLFEHLSPSGGSSVSPPNVVKKPTAQYLGKQILLLLNKKPLDSCFRGIELGSDKNANRDIIGKVIQEAGSYLAADQGFLADPCVSYALKQ